MEALPDMDTVPSENITFPGETAIPEGNGIASDDSKLSAKSMHALPRRSRYVRSEGSPLPSLTAQKVAIMRYLAELRFLSLPQLARLTCPSEKSARRHLRELFDAALVEVIPVSRVALSPAGTADGPQLLHGSAPNLYMLTEKGSRLLVDTGQFGPELLRRPPPKYGPKNSLFLAHELQIRDVRVWLQSMASAFSAQRVLRWHDGQDAVLSLPGNQPGPNIPPARMQTPKNRDSQSHASQTAVRPDAWFIQQLLPERFQEEEQTENPQPSPELKPPLVLVGLVEIDRGTERGGRRWSEKLEAYSNLFADRSALAAATGYVNARVLVIAPNAQRRDGLASWLETTVGELRMPPAVLSRFWLADQEVLARTDLTEACWRRPGSTALWPLVSAQTLTG